MNGYDRFTESWKPRLALVTLGIFAGGMGFACVYGDAATQAGMLGASTVLATNSLNHFFGSSVSSARKDQTIADANQRLAESTPPQQQ